MDENETQKQLRIVASVLSKMNMLVGKMSRGEHDAELQLEVQQELDFLDREVKKRSSQ